jgi:hypothetical protein
MHAGTADMVYCDDPQSLSEAAAAVRQAGAAVVDCEGHELGDAQGRLTIIQIIPINPQPVSYVVDVVELQVRQAPALQPLMQLLADPAITKVMFDCRNDATALWHELDCKLQVRQLQDRRTSCLYWVTWWYQARPDGPVSHCNWSIVMLGALIAAWHTM